MSETKHTVTVEYCVPCSYLDRAIEETRGILRNWAPVLSEVTLVTGGRGHYEIKVDGDLVFSKAELGRFPESGEVENRLQERLGKSLAGL